MTTYNTCNPIGSTDSRDRLDNTENMDYLENSTTELTHADRLGTIRKTRHGMEVEHDAQIAAHETEHDAQMQSFENDFDGRLAGMAFTRVGSFTSGATLTDMRQVLIWEVSQGGDGHEYGWTGTFEKVVAAGSSPATSGGISAGAWVDRTDAGLRGELADPGGASLVGVVQNEVGAVQTTVQRKLYESISIFDFLTDAQIASVKARDGAFDLTEQIQKAVDTGKSIFFPPGLYYKSGPVYINVTGTSLVGSVEAEIRSQSYGFGVFASHFMASGITYSCVTVGYIFIANPLSSAGLDNLTWFNCRFLNGFYAVRTGLEVANVNNWPIRGVRVIGCESIAPIGVNCGHLLATKCEDVYFLLNKVKYGLNSSAYGICACTRATIIGNIEEAVSDTVLDVEAAIQVEDSPNARVTIANNVCLHDIWVSDSSDVTITGNQCRDLRTTIGNPTSQGVGKVLFTGNKAGRIRAEAYAVSPPPVTFNVTYDSNQLDPSSYLKNGSVLPNAVFLDTAFAGNVTIARSNVISSGLGTTVALARNGANSRVYLLDNDFGMAPHAIFGSNGYVFERNSINPLFPRYMSAGLGATITTPVLGGWTKLVCNSITTDVNTEYNASTGVFTVKRTGTYRVGGMVTVLPGVTGSEMGMGLFRTSTSVEVARLTHGNSGGVNFAALTLRPLTMPMAAGEQYELRYFLMGAGTQILAGRNLTEFTIDRVS